MSSWVQASWVVQRIVEELKIPEKIDQYNNKINQLTQDMNTLNNSLSELGSIDTVQQMQNKIKLIEDEVKNVVNNKKFSFITTQQNNGTPNAVSAEEIYKDSIWYVITNILTEQE